MVKKKQNAQKEQETHKTHKFGSIEEAAELLKTKYKKVAGFVGVKVGKSNKPHKRTIMSEFLVDRRLVSKPSTELVYSDCIFLEATRDFKLQIFGFGGYPVYTEYVEMTIEQSDELENLISLVA